jgi:hypothetical protein
MFEQLTQTLWKRPYSHEVENRIPRFLERPNQQKQDQARSIRTFLLGTVWGHNETKLDNFQSSMFDWSFCGGRKYVGVGEVIMNGGKAGLR